MKNRSKLLHFTVTAGALLLFASVGACSSDDTTADTTAGDSGTVPNPTTTGTPPPPTSSEMDAGNPADGSTTDGAGSTSSACEALCVHIETSAATCSKNNAGPHTTCLEQCASLSTKSTCAAQASALVACCTAHDLKTKCTDNVLDVRDCDDSDICPTEGAALKTCSP